MAIPSSGPLTLGDIQTEFGGSNPISLSEYYAGGSYVPAGTTGTYGAVPSSGEISIRNFYGTSAFSLAFNNAENIALTAGASSGSQPSVQATYSILANATCTKFGNPSLSPSTGPTAWGTPTGGTPGNNYEARLNVSGIYIQSGGDYVKFAGVNVTAVGFTSWYALSSTRAIDVYAEQVADVQGTLYIRNTSTLVEISRSFAIYTDNGL